MHACVNPPPSLAKPAHLPHHLALACKAKLQSAVTCSTLANGPVAKEEVLSKQLPLGHALPLQHKGGPTGHVQGASVRDGAARHNVPPHGCCVADLVASKVLELVQQGGAG